MSTPWRIALVVALSPVLARLLTRSFARASLARSPDSIEYGCSAIQAMMVNPKDTVLRKIWVGLAITIVFIAATVLLVSVPASRFTDPTAREYGAGIARVIVGLIAIVTIRQRNWGLNA
jgi:hypothetical protein